MQKKIHPKYDEITVNCSCGNTFKVASTLGRELHLEICDKCHPFYTGKTKMVDTAGVIDRFRKKYANRGVAANRDGAKGK